MRLPPLGVVMLALALGVAVFPLACGGEDSGDKPKPATTTQTMQRIYLDICGSAGGHLAYRPRRWSSGCTGESANVRAIKWLSYGGPTASGKGRALQWASPEEGPYRGPASLRLDRVRKCSSRAGKVRLYYTRVRYAANLGPPLGRVRSVSPTFGAGDGSGGCRLVDATRGF
jgi:hypothetical protein